MRKLIWAIVALGLVGLGRWGTPLEATFIPSPVKSIQQVSIAFAGANTAAAVITAIVPGNSILMYQGHVSADNVSALVPCDAFMLGTITDATHITAISGGTGATCAPTAAAKYNAVVVEYIPQFIKSQGCGTIAPADGASTGTATITAVVVAKTIVALTGFGQLAAGAPMTMGGLGGQNVATQLGWLLTLTNTTTITATGTTLSTPSGLRRIGYCYLEFK